MESWEKLSEEIHKRMLRGINEEIQEGRNSDKIAYEIVDGNSGEFS